MAQVWRSTPGISPWHEAFTAGFIERAGSRFHQRHGQAEQPRLNRRGQPGRAATDNHQVKLTHLSDSSARFSVGMRQPSSRMAFSTVNTTAVTHAVCTIARVNPSMATIQ